MVLLLLFLVLFNLFLLVTGLIPIVMILLVIDLVLLLLLLRLASIVIKKTSRSKFRSAIDATRVTAKDPYFTVGILHPFCNSGGGGERVLWSAVKALQDKYPNCVCVIYTGDRQATGDEMVRNACDRFQIKLNPDRTKFIYLRLRSLVLDKYYPMFTLLGQSLGSVVLGIECFFKFIPDVYMETTGYAFTYPLFHYLASTPVCCYTHYPTISTDMLELVANSRENFNNRSSISRSPTLTRVKLAYYHLFARLYSWCGRCADCIMVNSTWTQNHINQLWQLAYKTKIVYPPCDVKLFEPVFGDARHDQQFHIASVAQFRPEKNHSMQVRALAKFIQKLKENGVKAQELEKVKLVLIGSCRNEEDQQRVDGLKALAKSLSIENHCEFKVNFKFDLLLTNLAEAAVGIHSMIDEHFGIGVVECMAAGTCMIAHNSAGPKMDIVVPYRGKQTGYLADTDEQYAEHLYSIYTKSVSQRNEIRQAAREHVKRFSQENFDVDFVEAFDSLCFTKFIGKPTESNDKAE